MDRHHLCEFLLSAGLVTRERLDDALAEQRASAAPVRLLALLVERGGVAEIALTQALSRRLSIPWVRVEPHEATGSVLALIPRDTAERFSLFPVYVRREQSGPPTLYVAMDDPTWEEALFTVSIVAGMPVRPLLATRSQVSAAIARHYAARDTGRPTRPAIPVADNDDLIVIEYTSEIPRRASAY
jgi:type IV pilus assembly protein PilB